MDDAFYAYFRESLENFQFQSRGPRVSPGGRFPFEPQAHYVASGALEAARREADASGRSIRPDGELMLYLLSREFVAKPGLAVRGFTEPDLDVVLGADARTLVAASDEGDEISAHAVVDALSARWEGLSSASLEIWGP